MVQEHFPNEVYAIYGFMVAPWTIVGILWKEKSLIFLNGSLTLMYVVGVAKHLYSFVAKNDYWYLPAPNGIGEKMSYVDAYFDSKRRYYSVVQRKDGKRLHDYPSNTLFIMQTQEANTKVLTVSPQIELFVKTQKISQRISNPTK